MARIKLGPVVTDISGSIGGITFQRNKFGLTMRAKPLPLYSKTPSQLTIRSYISKLQGDWQGLEDADRLQWNRFLNYSGQTILRDRSVLLSGQGLFIKYNLYRLLCGLPVLATILYATMPHYSLPDYLSRIGEGLFLHFPLLVFPEYWFFIFKVTNPRHSGQVYSSKGLRFMVTRFEESDTFDITDPYIKAFGVLPLVYSWYHYNILFFHTNCPIYTGIFSGTAQVTSN